MALVVDKADLFADNWIYVHEPKVKVGRIQNFRSWSPEMGPHATLACLGLEYFCFEGDGLWTASDAALITLGKKELAMIGLVREDEVKDGCVVRQKKAYPVYDDGYKANVETVRCELAEKYPTLHLVGRNGMHKYNNHDHAMMTSMLTVKNILANAPPSTTRGMSMRTPSTMRRTALAPSKPCKPFAWCRAGSAHGEGHASGGPLTRCWRNCRATGSSAFGDVS